MRTLITNGLVVTADPPRLPTSSSTAETIALIGTGLAGRGVTADATIDATGRYIVPGGIDVHTHMEMPFGARSPRTLRDGLESGRFGGTTTILDFARRRKVDRSARGSTPGVRRPRGTRRSTTAST